MKRGMFKLLLRVLFVAVGLAKFWLVYGMEERAEGSAGMASSAQARVDDRCPIIPINKISQIDTRKINEHDVVLFDIDGTLVHDHSVAKGLIDKDTAKFIRLLQSKGALCIAFTSRRIDRMEETTKELKKLGIDFSDVPLKSVKLPEVIDIDVSMGQKYQDGIIYTSETEFSEGEAYREKGGILVAFFYALDALKETVGAGLRFRKIIFVDDRQSELESVRDVVAAIIAQQKAREFHLYKLDTGAAERRLKGKTKLYGPDQFPHDLRELTCIEHSTEGSTGMFILKDPQGKKYTFKCLSDPDVMKEEILADAIYEALGVPVPHFALYDEKPDLSVNGVTQKCDTMGPYRVSEFIVKDKDKAADVALVKDKIKKHFVIDAFMANRDVVVDNFENIIVDANGTPYRIDNRASLRYTSVGRVKHGENGYDIYKATELYSLRDPQINPAGAQVYELTPDEIDQQIRDLLGKQDRIFTTIDEFAKVLDIDDPEGLKNILERRLKYLEEQMQGFSRIVGAYEKAQTGTSASVLMYTQIAPIGDSSAGAVSASADTYVLLGRRVNDSPGIEDGWSNLGGKSDVGTGEDDQLLADTAAREVREESVGLITFTSLQLIDCPSHDLIDEQEKLFHRMYLAPYHFVEPEELRQKVTTAKDIHQKEYTEFAWVKVDDSFLEALAKEQEYATITTSDGRTITITFLENFRKMLAQPQVITLLTKIKARKKTGNLHTRSVVGQEPQELAYTWQQRGGHWVRKYKDGREELAVQKPESIQRRERAENFMAQAQMRANLLRELREKGRARRGEPTQPSAEVLSKDYQFTQTEAFLSLVMGGGELPRTVALTEDTKFQQEAREQNVDKFLKQHPIEGGATDQEFCYTLKAVYKNELDNKNWFVFYHAADPAVAFLWDFYTEFRNQLQYVQNTDVRALRGWDEFFKGIAEASAFIVTAQKESGSKFIDNYAGKYQERGLSVNFALFGSYGTQGCSSYELFYDSKSQKPPDTAKLLLAFLTKVGVPLSFKNHILAIKDKYFPDLANGRLLQIFMNERVVDQAVYLSYPMGRLLNPDNNNADLPAQRMLALLRTTPKGFMKEIREKAKEDKNLVSLQARVFLKPEIMFNPEMVHIISYMRYPLIPKVRKLYQEEMQAMVKQLLSYVLVAHVTADDTFSTQQPLLRDYKHHYQAVTGKKYSKGELADITAVKNYIDVGNVAGLEQCIEKNPEILKELVPELNYSDRAFRGAKNPVVPFSYALRYKKTEIVVDLIKKGKWLDAAVAAAMDGIKEDSTRQGALVLWQELFEEGYGIDVAIKAASDGVVNPNRSVSHGALALWVTLLTKNQGVDEAIAAAKKGMANSDYGVQAVVLALFKELIKKDKEVDEALAAAKKGIVSSDSGVRVEALKLFEELIKEDKGVDKAIEIAKKGILSSDDRAQTVALELFKELIKKDKEVDEAIAAAKKGILSSDSGVRREALELFKELIKKDKGVDEAVEVATKGILSSDYGVRMEASELFKELIKKDKGIDEAVEVAKKRILSNDYGVQKVALKLFNELIKKDKGVKEAIEAAKIGIVSNNPGVLEVALELFKELIRQDKGVDEAVEVAKKRIFSSDYGAQFVSLELFTALIRQDKGVDEAIEVAKKGIANSDYGVQTVALELFKELIKKGRGVVDAKDILRINKENGLVSKGMEALVQVISDLDRVPEDMPV